MENQSKSIEELIYQLDKKVNKKSSRNRKHRLSKEDLSLNSLLISAAKHNTEDFEKLKKIKEFKCPVCKKVKYTSTKLLYNHVLKEHASEIPDNMPVEQYVFNLRNNKTSGKCVICGNPTEWNPKTCKYHRICSEDCKKKYIEETRKRLLRTHGTDDLSKDPEHQKKMLDNRKISKPYKFKDGKEIIANSSYEYDFLKYMEEVLGYTSTDIQSCDIIFRYQFEGKEHFYIPDFYMPDYNLIIEVKDEGSKASFIARMRQMDIAKYTEVTKSGKYNFITVVGKDYTKLIEVLDYLKNKAYNTDASKKLIIEIDKKNYKNINVPKQYRLDAASRSYESLSIYHESLIKSFNNRLSFLDSYSTEGIVDNISKFISWFKDMINRLITMISTFIKRIIAKIYELTLRFNNKDDIYHEFKSQIFTSVNIPIKDKKLNPNMMNDMEEYIQRINDWNESFKGELETKTVSERFDEIYEKSDQYLYGNDYKSEMNELLSNLKEDGIGNYIDKIFYSESKKSNTTIREYFGCNAGQTPKQLIILSKEYTDKLVKVKNETQQFLNELVKKKKDLISIMEKEKLDEERVNHYKNIIKNITYFHNMNYTFFIKAIRVRGKVAKYILKGSLGGLFESIEGLVTGEEYKEKETHLEVFRELPSPDIEIFHDKRGICYIAPSELKTNRENKFTIFYKSYQYQESEMFYKEYFNLIQPILEYQSKRAKGERNNNSLYPHFKKIWDFLNIPYPLEEITFTTIDYGDDFSGKYLKKISITFLVTFYKYELKEEDKLYHTSTVPNLKSLSAYSDSFSISEYYLKPRIYFGLNQILSKKGDINHNNWKKFLLEIITNPHPLFGGRKDAKKMRVYVVEKTPNLTVYGDPQFYKFNSLEKIKNSYKEGIKQSVYTSNLDNVPVIDITNLIKNYAEINNKEINNE